MSASTRTAQGSKDQRELGSCWQKSKKYASDVPIVAWEALVRSRNLKNIWANVEKSSTVHSQRYLCKFYAILCYRVPDVDVQNKQWGKEFYNLSCFLKFDFENNQFSNHLVLCIQTSDLYSRWKHRTEKYQRFFRSPESASLAATWNGLVFYNSEYGRISPSSCCFSTSALIIFSPL